MSGVDRIAIARRYVRRDLDDALNTLESAEQLTPETGLTPKRSQQLADAIAVAKGAVKAARRLAPEDRR